MVKRYMQTFNVPLSRHSYCQKFCTDVCNHLASRKLKWRTPQEKLTSNTPDILVFHFHFWEVVKYFDSNEKQPHDGWKPGPFLGIAWDSGDAMTYIVEPTLHSRGRPYRPLSTALYTANLLTSFLYPSISGRRSQKRRMRMIPTNCRNRKQQILKPNLKMLLKPNLRKLMNFPTKIKLN